MLKIFLIAIRKLQTEKSSTHSASEEEILKNRESARRILEEYRKLEAEEKADGSNSDVEVFSSAELVSQLLASYERTANK